jgi:hypothetical protein
MPVGRVATNRAAYSDSVIHPNQLWVCTDVGRRPRFYAGLEPSRQAQTGKERELTDKAGTWVATSMLVAVYAFAFGSVVGFTFGLAGVLAGIFAAVVAEGRRAPRLPAPDSAPQLRSAPTASHPSREPTGRARPALRAPTHSHGARWHRSPARAAGEEPGARRRRSHRRDGAPRALGRQLGR